jgi:hypothetical protein
MDKAMHRIGLHGKSFIPLLMGFGCNVPAILSTRMIESRRDRLVTMLIIPSCLAAPAYLYIFSSSVLSLLPIRPVSCSDLRGGRLIGHLFCFIVQKDPIPEGGHSICDELPPTVFRRSAPC